MKKYSLVFDGRILPGRSGPTMRPIMWEDPDGEYYRCEEVDAMALDPLEKSIVKELFFFGRKYIQKHLTGKHEDVFDRLKKKVLGEKEVEDEV